MDVCILIGQCLWHWWDTLTNQNTFNSESTCCNGLSMLKMILSPGGTRLRIIKHQSMVKIIYKIMPGEIHLHYLYLFHLHEYNYIFPRGILLYPYGCFLVLFPRGFIVLFILCVVFYVFAQRKLFCYFTRTTVTPDHAMYYHFRDPLFVRSRKRQYPWCMFVLVYEKLIMSKISKKQTSP